MTRPLALLAAAPLAGLLMTTAASAQPAPGTYMSFARIVTNDVEKTAKFYEATLGIREVSRGVSQRSGPWIQLNFGATDAEAKANPSTKIFVGNAQPGQTPGTVSHLGFYVPDTRAAVERAMAAGGSLAEPVYEVKMADGTRVIAYVKDPFGNQVEILSIKK